MKKELQDYVWACLPKEFKEEVKKEWQTANNEERLPHDAFMRGCYSTMVLLFGIHNLTSDAEGEDEMLCVSRNEVRAIYNKIDSVWLRQGLERLFGSKCLPDEEPKPAEPTCTQTCTDDCQSQCESQDQFPDPAKMVDNIIKDGFKKHNRLHIAAMIIASIMGSNDWSDYRGATNEDIWRNMAKTALGVADALLHEAEKGGES